MPRNISFALTTEQVRNRTKTVTRRLGWKDLKPGTLLQPVVKAQGIPKGGKVEKIGGLIRVTGVSQEPLDGLNHPLHETAFWEVRREGFPEMTPAQFVAFFARTHNCDRSVFVTRIAFEYLPDYDAALGVVSGLVDATVDGPPKKKE